MLIDSSQPQWIVATLVAGSAVKYLASYLITHQESKSYELVGRVSELWLYPFKSCRGIKVQRGECTALGLSCFGITDRHWAIAGPDGVYLTQRQEPKMALINVEVKGDVLKLDAPEMPSVFIPIKPHITPQNMSKIQVKMDIVPSVDCGDEVSDWLIRYFSRPGLRLHYAAPQLEKRHCVLAQKNWNHLAKEGDMVALSDYCGYMMFGSASLNELNQRLTTPVPADNFRANIIVGDSPAFEEDNWVSLRIGKAQFRALDACTRCLLVTVDQSKGIKDKQEEPLKTLKKFRLKEPYGPKPTFGMNYTLDTPGPIKVGDPVYAKRGQLNISAKESQK